MSVLSWIILFCVLGGIASVLAAALFLLFPERYRTRALPHLISYAIGALLGAAFLALLPHALGSPEVADVHDIGLAVLLGVLLFFVLEKFVLWRHCHDSHCEAHDPHELPGKQHASGSFVLIGDAIHNFVDGMLIAAAFLTDIHLGIVTALAVAAHEIPQEVSDFAVLLHSGFTRLKAFVFNMLSSLATVLGGVLAYFSLKDLDHILPYALAIAASSFIYVAVADLIPTLHRRMAPHDTIKQIVLIGAGVLTIYLSHSMLH